MRRTTVRELGDELRGLTGAGGSTDAVVPPLVFVTVNAFGGLQPAIYAGGGVAVVLVAARLLRRRPLRYALSGVVGTALALWLTARSGRAESYFLPGIVSGTVVTMATLASIAARRPLVAWTSWVTRGWPIEWYWHPRVRPAYTLTSWLWAAFFGVRTGVQAWLFSRGDVTTLGIVRVVTGWPGLLTLLVATYLVGRSRLAALAGPSVEEFTAAKPPPWQGQQRGF